MALTGGGASPARVAPNRIISTADPDARHAHKTVHRRQDGFKAHIAVEPETRGNGRRVQLTLGTCVPVVEPYPTLWTARYHRQYSGSIYG